MAKERFVEIEQLRTNIPVGWVENQNTTERLRLITNLPALVLEPERSNTLDADYAHTKVQHAKGNLGNSTIFVLIPWQAHGMDFNIQPVVVQDLYELPVVLETNEWVTKNIRARQARMRASALKTALALKTGSLNGAAELT